MFARLFRSRWRNLLQPKTLLTATALFTYAYFKNNIHLDSPPPTEEEPKKDFEPMKNLEQYIHKLQIVEVCEGKELLENQRKVVKVRDHEGRERKIIVLRKMGTLFAVSGTCPYHEPFDDENVQYSLEDSAVFNDKLYCPHHGCIFDIKSGSIEHGPALENLPIFMAEEQEGIVKLMYPSAIPTSVTPNLAERDVEDLRKVLILGGDDSATIGCLNGLRQFGYQGQITVVKEGSFTYPYRKEYLHKKLLNLHLNDPPNDPKPVVPEQKDEKSKGKTKKTKEQKQKNKQPEIKVPTLSEADMKKLVQKQLEEKVYNKLKYFSDSWYEHYAIDFVFQDEAYRIINKQYYPYITFADGTKLEFDALLVATGVVQNVPAFEGITTTNERDMHINLTQNVFCPLRSKQEHSKLNKFLNCNVIKSLLVLGYNIEGLEFIEALKKEFPDIKVTLIDRERDSSLSEFIGPELQKNVIQQFTSRGVEFYIKIRDELLFSNQFSVRNIRKRALEEKKKQRLLDAKNSQQKEDPRLRYKDAVTVRISDDLRVKADGVVIFPHEFAGNTEWIRNGKYTDFDFKQENRLGGDPFGRTDNIRIFSAGFGSINEYFLLNKRLVSCNPILAYEQGFNVSLNMQALRIPFTYVPYEKYEFFGKKFFYIGTRDFYDSILVIGSIEKWDFLAIYASGKKVTAVSGSPSRAKQLSIIREAFRVNCLPSFDDLLSGYWSVENLAKLIYKLNKSGCYRDVIFRNRENIHRKDLIWMERTPDAGFQNDRPQPSEQYPSVQVGPNGTLKEL